MSIGPTRVVGVGNQSRAGSPKRIAIIGAGISGISLGYYLREQGIDTFTIFEASDGPGGTWRHNRYPGAACDVPSILYSFSFDQKLDWSASHPGQPEILAYIEQTLDRFDLRRTCRFNTSVTSLVWHEPEAQWELTTEADGPSERFDIVVSCVGLLNVPRIPTLPGTEEFAGTQIHTARWPAARSLRGKRVAVVGTGSSASQVVPAIADEVETLYVYQRQPGWQFSKADHTYSTSELAINRRRPRATRIRRAREFWKREVGAWAIKPGSKQSQKRADASLSWLETAITDPKLRAQLTPDYPVGCKRLIKDKNFYPTLNLADVKLVPFAVSKLTPTGIQSEDGEEREVDTIVWATGFQPTRFLSTLTVRGRRGVLLSDAWDELGGPEAFLGLSVSGFPNLFMMYGPNTNSATTSLIWVLEQQARYLAKVARRVVDRNIAVIDVSSTAQSIYSRWIQRKAAVSIWSTGCNNYFRTPSGKTVTQWPHTASLYWALLRILGPAQPLLYDQQRWDDRQVLAPVTEATRVER